MKRCLYLLGALAFLAVPKHACAQMEDPLLTLPDGQVILNISATERVEVEQDLLVATLSYVAVHRDAGFIQNEINTAMKQGLDRVRKEKDVKVNTGAYQVFETRDPKTKERLWRGSQTLTLKSTNAQAVLDLAGRLQDLKLTMNGLTYTISPEKAAEIQDGLLEAALIRLQKRADRAAKALGKSAADLRDVNTQGDVMPYMQKSYARGAMMMEAASADMAPPVAQAGEETISLTVSARAILKP